MYEMIQERTEALRKTCDCIEHILAEKLPMSKADLMRTHVLVRAPSHTKKILVVPYEFYVWAAWHPDSEWIDPLREDKRLYTKYISLCKRVYRETAAAVNLRSAFEKAFTTLTEFLVGEAFQSCAYHLKRKDRGFRTLGPAETAWIIRSADKRPHASFLDPMPYFVSCEVSGHTLDQQMILCIFADAILDFYLEFSTVEFGKR